MYELYVSNIMHLVSYHLVGLSNIMHLKLVLLPSNLYIFLNFMEFVLLLKFGFKGNRLSVLSSRDRLVYFLE